MHGVSGIFKELNQERDRERWGGGCFKTRPSAKGRPYTGEFEAHAVSFVAIGINAKQCRDQVLLNND